VNLGFTPKNKKRYSLLLHSIMVSLHLDTRSERSFWRGQKVPIPSLFRPQSISSEGRGTPPSRRRQQQRQQHQNEFASSWTQQSLSSPSTTSKRNQVLRVQNSPPSAMTVKAGNSRCAATPPPPTFTRTGNADRKSSLDSAMGKMARPSLLGSTNKRLQSLVQSLGSATKANPATSSPNHGLAPAACSPQRHLDQLLQQRGYTATTFRSLETAYFQSPTPFQTASHGRDVMFAVRSNNTPNLRQLMPYLSWNPCTSKGESIWHMVCRQGSLEQLQVLLEHYEQQHGEGTCLFPAVDHYGRTVLHNACWAPEPALDVVQCLLDRNPALLFLRDSRGALPLSYIHCQHWPLWIDFLNEHVPQWFPAVKRSTSTTGETLTNYERGLALARQPPSAMPRIEALPTDWTLDQVALLAAGQISLDQRQEGTGEEHCYCTPIEHISGSLEDVDSDISDIDDSSVSTAVGFGGWDEASLTGKEGAESNGFIMRGLSWTFGEAKPAANHITSPESCKVLF